MPIDESWMHGYLRGELHQLTCGGAHSTLFPGLHCVRENVKLRAKANTINAFISHHILLTVAMKNENHQNVYCSNEF